MAQQSKTTNNAAASSTTNLREEAKPATLHDFLGMRPVDSPILLPSKLADPRFGETSPSASVFAGRGPISSASDLGSVEKQVRSHLEGIPFYGQRSDVSGTEISNRIMRSKRSNSNTAFMGHDSIESLNFIKMVRNGLGSEQAPKSNEDEVFLGMQPMKQSSPSLIQQPSTTGKADSSLTKWSIPMNIGSVMPNCSRGGQHVSFVHQVPPNKFKETNAGPSIISLAAADEGSRTGIKDPGILSSISTSSLPRKNTAELLQSGRSLKAGARISVPESSIPASRQGSTSMTRQMTIFYAGQAHVFDDVHPNKADIIMALAGSNGGSWSTTLATKSASKTINEGFFPTLELQSAANMAFSQEFHARRSTTGQGTVSGDRITLSTGVVTKDARNFAQSVEPYAEEKH